MIKKIILDNEIEKNLPEFLNQSEFERIDFIISNDSSFNIQNQSEFLKKILDSLIFKDIKIRLFNFPLCFFLGYKRYIQKTEDLHKPEKCNNCVFLDNCAGISLSLLKSNNNLRLKPINMKSIMTDNEKCMLKILNTQNNITTSKVLELAKQFPICNDCSTGSHVVDAGEKLIRKNMVEKEFSNNGYLWYLKK